jgi:hypothetical protein
MYFAYYFNMQKTAKKEYCSNACAHPVNWYYEVDNRTEKQILGLQQS